jgi:hypothetical protein
MLAESIPVPEFIDPVFAKTIPKRSFSVIENERFGLVFAKSGYINSGTGLIKSFKKPSLRFSLVPYPSSLDCRVADVFQKTI